MEGAGTCGYPQVAHTHRNVRATRGCPSRAPRSRARRLGSPWPRSLRPSSCAQSQDPRLPGGLVSCATGMPAAPALRGCEAVCVAVASLGEECVAGRRGLPSRSTSRGRLRPAAFARLRSVLGDQGFVEPSDGDDTSSATGWPHGAVTFDSGSQSSPTLAACAPRRSRFARRQPPPPRSGVISSLGRKKTLKCARAGERERRTRDAAGPACEPDASARAEPCEGHARRASDQAPWQHGPRFSSAG